MASKTPLYAILLIGLLLQVQTLSAFQVLFEGDPVPQHILAFRPTEDSHKVVIAVDNITKALWDAGFKIMSLILERNLHSYIPYNNIEDGNNNTITIYNNNSITIFIPSDEDVNFKRWNRGYLDYQIVTSKVDKEAFDSGSLAKGLMLHSLSPRADLIVSGPASIVNAKITHWDIYNDGHVIVHGVDSFFNEEVYIYLWRVYMRRMLVKYY